MISYISHEGVAHDEDPPGRGSGRYGWGTGEDPNQHMENTLYYRVQERKMALKKEFPNMSTSEMDRLIFNEYGDSKISMSDFKNQIRISREGYNKAYLKKMQDTLAKYDGNRSKAAAELGINESTFRSKMNAFTKDTSDRVTNTANIIEDYVKRNLNGPAKGMIDVGSDQNLYMGVTSSTFDSAISYLKQKGYVVHNHKVEQLGTGHFTTFKVLCPPGTEWKDMAKNILNVKSISDYYITKDHGETFQMLQKPTNFDSKRLAIKFAEDGGIDRDGLIEIRRGLPDLTLGPYTYAQVRIAVDGTHYLKGMACYSDDLPKGVDIRFNTNKTKDVPVLGPKDHSVLKPLKKYEDDNPSSMFGATIKPNGQNYYIDKDGQRKLSPVNIISGEGDWLNWSKTFSSQSLAKQGADNIKLLTNKTILEKNRELEEVLNLTNKVIKEKMLNDFADKCDTMAADLDVHGLKGQGYHVLLPVPSLKDGEIYAPNYKNGEKVALIRYPHQGVWEIVEATVNNKNKEAIQMMGTTAKDAIGIRPSQAAQLSGADFDGDTATVLPLSSNPQFKIRSMERMKDLADWDYHAEYKLPDGATAISKKMMQTEMGKTTNLLMDATIQVMDNKTGNIDSQGLTDLKNITKHALVAIDSEKHRLDWKRSRADQHIDALANKYQSYVDSEGRHHNSGASTILTRAGKKQNEVSERVLMTNPKISNYRKEKLGLTDEQVADYEQRYKNGERVYIETGALRKERKAVKLKKNELPEDVFNEYELSLHNQGKTVYRDTGKMIGKKSNIKPMYLTDDARTLVRDRNNPIEMAYADYANELKSLANSARKESRSLTFDKVNPSAKKAYAKEVEELKAAIKLAKMNNPRERLAALIANANFRDKKRDNPGMDDDHLKKEKNRSLRYGREIAGAKKDKIVLTDRQWEAIQSHAVSTNMIRDILANTDPDKFKARAMPKKNDSLTDGEKARMKALVMQVDANGKKRYTNAEIAEIFGVSATTVSRISSEE